MKKKAKNLSQMAKGKIRASSAKRDSKGRFLKADYLAETQPEVQPKVQPEIQPKVQPKVQPIIITTITKQKDQKENMKEEKNKRAFERLVDKAMEDDYWIELLHMQTGLPFDKERTEIANIFKRHVIIMGNESQIISEKDAKNYFANFSRKGSITHKAILAELKREKTTLWKGKENPYRYEETDARTGERSYCGIPIPSDAPPRPDANSVWNKNHSRWEL